MTPGVSPLFSSSSLSQPGLASFIGENGTLAEASIRLYTSENVQKLLFRDEHEA